MSEERRHYRLIVTDRLDNSWEGRTQEPITNSEAVESIREMQKFDAINFTYTSLNGVEFPSGSSVVIKDIVSIAFVPMEEES